MDSHNCFSVSEPESVSAEPECALCKVVIISYILAFLKHKYKYSFFLLHCHTAVHFLLRNLAKRLGAMTGGLQKNAIGCNNYRFPAHRNRKMPMFANESAVRDCASWFADNDFYSKTIKK